MKKTQCASIRYSSSIHSTRLARGAFACLGVAVVSLGMAACGAENPSDPAAGDGESSLGTAQEAVRRCGPDPNSLVSQLGIPSSFPFDAVGPQALVGFAGAECAAYGVANFDPGCGAHDICYNTPLVTQSQCDNALLKSWDAACEEAFTYNEGDVFLAIISGGVAAAHIEGCKQTCKAAANAMADIVKSSGGPFFAASQSNAHGFLILSDKDPKLALRPATPRAQHLSELTLSDTCTVSDPDCRWQYRDGMIVNERDTKLAINAYGGPSHLGEVRLHNGCSASNPDCTWTIRKGRILSDNGSSFGINAFKGAARGGKVLLYSNCPESNPDCTWKLKDIKLNSQRSFPLAVNATGGAKHLGFLHLSDVCRDGNPDCTWSVAKGEIRSTANSSLAINAFNGAAHGTVLRLHNNCSPSNPDCTWTWRRGGFFSDVNSGLMINAVKGARPGARLELHQDCRLNNKDCTFWSLSGR